MRRYEAGETARGLARAFGCSDSAVERVIRQAGVEKHGLGKVSPWKGTAEQQIEVVRRYQAGESVRMIASSIGCRSDRISETLAAHGVAIRPSGKHRRFSDDQAVQLAEEYQAGASLETLSKRHGVNTATVRNTLQRLGVEARPSARPVFWTDERVAEVVHLYQDGWSQEKIAVHIGSTQSAVSLRLIKAGVITRTRLRRETHPRWNGGRRIVGGYVHVKPNDGDEVLVKPLSNGYIPEHRLVMARALGRPLLKSETVHHINGDRADNRLTNLQLRQGNHGKGVRMQCNACGSHDVAAVSLP